jgi:hypothetical protein
MRYLEDEHYSVQKSGSYHQLDEWVVLSNYRRQAIDMHTACMNAAASLTDAQLVVVGLKLNSYIAGKPLPARTASNCMYSLPAECPHQIRMHQPAAE